MRALRDAACEYADRGWAIHPLKPRSKVPATEHGMNDATSDLARVFRWWEGHPRHNIGISCEASGLVVIDVDPRHGGDDSLHDLIVELGPLPPTVESLSGGGGQHLVFRNPGGSFAREITPTGQPRGKTSGVDIKASGYIVAPPSTHPSGAQYEWSVDGDPGEVSPADIPPAWLERMLVAPRREITPQASTHYTDALKNVPSVTYFSRLTGRSASGDWGQCPFHKGGQEKTPSLKLDGTLWACYGCEPILDKRVMGGNIYDLAALLWGIPIPLAPIDFAIARSKLMRIFDA